MQYSCLLCFRSVFIFSPGFPIVNGRITPDRVSIPRDDAIKRPGFIPALNDQRDVLSDRFWPISTAGRSVLGLWRFSQILEDLSATRTTCVHRRYIPSIVLYSCAGELSRFAAVGGSKLLSSCFERASDSGGAQKTGNVNRYGLNTPSYVYYMTYVLLCTWRIYCIILSTYIIYTLNL